MNEYYAKKVESQKQEIETIKERTITLKLSDADCDRIFKMAGMHDLTVGQLLENFIGDLVDGTYSNGSDERDRAGQWFERCWFSHMYEKTLLRHLLYMGHDIDDVLTTWDELKNYESHPEEYTEEVEDLGEGEKLWFEEDFIGYIEEFIEENKDADMEKEIEQCRKWLKDLQKLKGEQRAESRTESYYVELEEIREKFEQGANPTELMDAMERIFKIPALNDDTYNANNVEVMKLYHEISDRRDI